MKFRFPNLRQLFAVEASDENLLNSIRIRYMERNIGLPVKGLVVGLLFYYFFFSHWFADLTTAKDIAAEVTPHEFALEMVRRFFLIYVVINAGVACILLGMQQLPLLWVQRVVFTVAWIDALFLAALTSVTGGYDSILFWVFLGLILRNAFSTPDTSRQVPLNCFVTFCYLASGFLETVINEWAFQMSDIKIQLAILEGIQEGAAEPVVLRVFLLGLMTVCCYGVQILFERQRRAYEEAQEHAVRQDQLEAAGRLAAEIAHQLKNPLGIINNAAFTLQRTVKEGKTITQQIKIIREEVERSDRIITELMGYARLTEGKVEKLNVPEELDRAIEQVFPPAAKYETQIERDYAAALPPLLVQRSHLSEVFVNLLQNAREAMDGKGKIVVSAKYGDNYSVVISFADNGPGIPPDKFSKLFEPYFTTKTKGTGLGLAIVKHNTEIYGGHVQVESALGKGTTFTVTLPAKTLMKLRK